MKIDRVLSTPEAKVSVDLPRVYSVYANRSQSCFLRSASCGENRRPPGIDPVATVRSGGTDSDVVDVLN